MTDSASMTQIAGLFGWLVVAFIAAGIGGLASVNAGEFYESLVRPGWAPPARLFGPVWTVLYLCMGVAAWLVWRQVGFTAWLPFVLFSVQLVVNALWSWLFFYFRLGGVAFFEIILLWALIVATIVAFWRISLPAGILLLPYLAWVTFAGVLAYSVWRANPDLL
jgi:benzodiazapine receptor